MIELREQGKVRSIGVSNFTEQMLTAPHRRDRRHARRSTRWSCTRTSRRGRCARSTARTASARRAGARSPAAANCCTEQVLQELAEIHGVTPTQIVLRWHVQVGSTPIPKSADAERQRENADVFGFELTADEVGCDLRPRARAPLGRRPEHPRGDVARQLARVSACEPLREGLRPRSASASGSSDRCAGRGRMPGQRDRRDPRPRSPRAGVTGAPCRRGSLRAAGEIARPSGRPRLGERDQVLGDFAAAIG